VGPEPGICALEPKSRSELESVVLNRAVKLHAERRVFRNGRRTVVLK
jgi:formyltetrahydrofolate hydrolase